MESGEGIVIPAAMYARSRAQLEAKRSGSGGKRRADAKAADKGSKPVRKKREETVIVVDEPSCGASHLLRREDAHLWLSPSTEMRWTHAQLVATINDSGACRLVDEVSGTRLLQSNPDAVNPSSSASVARYHLRPDEPKRAMLNATTSLLGGGSVCLPSCTLSPGSDQVLARFRSLWLPTRRGEREEKRIRSAALSSKAVCLDELCAECIELVVTAPGDEDGGRAVLVATAPNFECFVDLRAVGEVTLQRRASHWTMKASHGQSTCRMEAADADGLASSATPAQHSLLESECRYGESRGANDGDAADGLLPYQPSDPLSYLDVPDNGHASLVSPHIPGATGWYRRAADGYTFVGSHSVGWWWFRPRGSDGGWRSSLVAWGTQPNDAEWDEAGLVVGARSAEYLSAILPKKRLASVGARLQALAGQQAAVSAGDRAQRELSHLLSQVESALEPGVRNTGNAMSLDLALTASHLAPFQQSDSFSRESAAATVKSKPPGKEVGVLMVTCSEKDARALQRIIKKKEGHFGWVTPIVARTRSPVHVEEQHGQFEDAAGLSGTYRNSEAAPGGTRLVFLDTPSLPLKTRADGAQLRLIPPFFLFRVVSCDPHRKGIVVRPVGPIKPADPSFFERVRAVSPLLALSSNGAQAVAALRAALEAYANPDQRAAGSLRGITGSSGTLGEGSSQVSPVEEREEDTSSGGSRPEANRSLLKSAVDAFFASAGAPQAFLWNGLALTPHSNLSQSLFYNVPNFRPSAFARPGWASPESKSPYQRRDEASLSSAPSRDLVGTPGSLGDGSVALRGLDSVLLRSGGGVVVPTPPAPKMSMLALARAAMRSLEERQSAAGRNNGRRDASSRTHAPATFRVAGHGHDAARRGIPGPGSRTCRVLSANAHGREPAKARGALLSATVPSRERFALADPESAASSPLVRSASSPEQADAAVKHGRSGRKPSRLRLALITGNARQYLFTLKSVARAVVALAGRLRAARVRVAARLVCRHLRRVRAMAAVRSHLRRARAAALLQAAGRGLAARLRAHRVRRLHAARRGAEELLAKRCFARLLRNRDAGRGRRAAGYARAVFKGYLDRAGLRRLRLVVRVQTWWKRGCWKRALRRRWAARAISRWYGACLRRRAVRREAALVVQEWWRQMLAGWERKKRETAAMTAQSAWRKYSAVAWADLLREHRAASRKQDEDFAKEVDKYHASAIVGRFFHKIARRQAEEKRRMSMAVVVQQFARTWLSVSTKEEKETAYDAVVTAQVSKLGEDRRRQRAALVIQRAFRAKTNSAKLHRSVDRLQVDRHKMAMLLLRDESAVVIQAHMRGYLTRKRVKNVIPIVERELHAELHRELLEESALIIQAAWLNYCADQLQWQQCRDKAAVCIQSLWKGFTSRRDTAYLKVHQSIVKHEERRQRATAALKIQTLWRCYKEVVLDADPNRTASFRPAPAASL
eukprot:gene17689-27226_t